MKRILAFFLSLVLFFSIFTLNINAIDYTSKPIVVDFVITKGYEQITNEDTRATGLIGSYGLSLTKTGTTLYLRGQTYGSPDVVTCGFKNLTVERRKTSDDSWKDYYEFGNVYVDAVAANLETTLVVESGYQYRISCKHYAKKNLLSVQTIANTSGIVTVS